MPISARGHRFRLAGGKQVAEGTPLAAPSYEFSMYDGGLMPEQDQREHEISGSTDLPGGVYVATAHASGDPVIVAEPRAVGFPIAMHLGADTVTGAGPYVHTMIRAETKPFTTWYEMFPGQGGGAADRWMRVSDAIVPAIELQFNQGDPLKVQADVLGKAARFNVTAPTPATDARGMASYFTYVGATVKLDAAATPATTIIRNIISGTIRSEYDGTEFEYTDDTTPYSLDLGRYNCSLSMDAKLDTYAINSLAYFGAASGADLDLTRSVFSGSAEFTFKNGPVADDTNKLLVVKMPSMRFTASWPTLDTGGGPVTVSIDGALLPPASGEPFTVVLTNAITTSYVA